MGALDTNGYWPYRPTATVHLRTLNTNLQSLCPKSDLGGGSANLDVYNKYTAAQHRPVVWVEPSFRIERVSGSRSSYCTLGGFKSRAHGFVRELAEIGVCSVLYPDTWWAPAFFTPQQAVFGSFCVMHIWCTDIACSFSLKITFKMETAQV